MTKITRQVDRLTTAEVLAPRLLRRAAAARYLSVSIPQLDQLRLMGEIEAVPMPGRKGIPIAVPLYDIQDLDRAIEKWKTARG